MDIDDDCVVTFEQTKASLEAVEVKLADRLGLQGSNVREQLLSLDRDNRLVEDELVADWHGFLASYLDWLSHGVKSQA